MPADTEALSLLATITAGVSFDIPAVDLSDPVFALPGDETAEFYNAVARVSLSDISDKTIEGPGAFDWFMAAQKQHLLEEHDNGRITGAEYTKAYIALAELAMTNAVQFMLTREAQFWEAQKGQIEAITLRAALEQQKQNTAKAVIDANTSKAQYALTVLKLASEEVTYDSAKYSLDNILPKQGLLITEQMEAARAQTMDTRSDGVTTIVGSVGKQKALYDQQIVSYQRDSEIKAAKVFADSWITQKTIDEGLLAPNAFTNASLDNVFDVVKTNLNMTGV